MAAFLGNLISWFNLNTLIAETLFPKNNKYQTVKHFLDEGYDVIHDCIVLQALDATLFAT